MAKRARRPEPCLGPDHQRQGEHPDRRDQQHPLDQHQHGLDHGFKHLKQPCLKLGLDASDGQAEQQREHHQRRHAGLRSRLDRIGGDEGPQPDAHGWEVRHLRRRMARGVAQSGHRLDRRRPGRQHAGDAERGERRRSSEQEREEAQRPRRRPARCGGPRRRGHPNDQQREHQRHDGHAQGVQPHPSNGIGHGQGVVQISGFGEGRAHAEPSHQAEQDPEGRLRADGTERCS